MDDSGKRELIYYLQSRTKGMREPIRAIDEIQERKHKEGHNIVASVMTKYVYLVARDRQNMTYSGVLGRGRIQHRNWLRQLLVIYPIANVLLHRFMEGI